MKKIISLVLVSVLGLTLAACTPKETSVGGTASLSDTDKVISDVSSIFDEATDFEDIAGIIENSSDINVNKNEDGSVTVELTNPFTPDEDKKGPAVPTIDNLVKPTPKPEKETEEAPEPEKAPDDKPDAKPEPAPTPAPETETEREPDTSPEITPEPTPEVKPEPEKKPEDEKKPEIKPNPYEGYTYTLNQKHTAVPLTSRYLYSKLNSAQKSWYQAIDKSVRNLETLTHFDDVVMSENRNYYIYFIYMFDNPELFYLGNTISLYNHGDGTSKIAYCYSDGENYHTAYNSPNEISAKLKASILEKKAIFDAEVNRIISTIPTNAPDVVKEKLIYDRILMDSHYNLGAKWNGVCEPNWNAYGIIVNKQGVCESYSEAFQVLCLAVGVNCTGIVGNAGGGHKWNVVQLGGEWYACDITFDDPIGGEQGAAYHYYFNRTTKEMEAMNHSTQNSDFPGPVCKGTKYSFKNCFGENYYG